MGAYSHLVIGNYETSTYKNDFYYDIVELLFTPLNYFEQAVEEGEREYVEKGFKSTVAECIDKLMVIGMSEDKVVIEYEKAKEDDIVAEYHNDFISMSYREYKEFVAECIYSGLSQYDLMETYTDTRRWLIDIDFCVMQSTEAWLYAILCSLKPNTIIKYDLSDVINSGWIKDDFIQKLNFEKIIILTEGKTDAKYIKKSLEVLFPHLKEKYHFIDFEATSLKGSASQLVHYVKSFISAGIKNKIIALFDNDTAGLEQLEILNTLNIPNNIKVLRYPDIKIAESYPTLGPTGKQHLNINGLACSIELYFGKDILFQNGGYTSIQWTGYNSKMEKYQGEILHKKEVQQKFENKLSMQKYDSGNSENWSEMKELLNVIFYAWSS